MLCPFCQYELDETQLSCSNCAAQFHNHGFTSLVGKFRTLLVSGALLVVATMMLHNCVINFLPGGIDSGYKAPGSPQVAYGPGPDMKDPDVRRLLLDWKMNIQPSQNPTNKHR